MSQSVAWGAGREDAFVQWIDYELREAQGARISIDRQHRDWLSQYRVSAKSAPKSFPYEGAFNYTLPLTAIDVNQLYASFMQTIHAPPNLWTTQALNERWKNTAKPMQDFLTLLDQRVLRMYNVNKRAFLECTKLGTALYKTYWRYEKRPYWTTDANLQRTQTTRIVSMPVVDHVRLSDFIIPAYSYDINPDRQGGAPWVGERHRVQLGQLYAMAEASEPFLPAVKKETIDLIRRFIEADRPETDVHIQQMDYERRQNNVASATKLDGDDFDRDRERGTPAGASLMKPQEIELWEIHARFGTRDGNGADDIVVWFHQPTRRIVRAVYARNERPYDKIVYLPGDGFFGIGVCEQKEMFQALGSDLTNFTLDNVVLANSRAIVAKAGANIAPGEPIYPWKVFMAEGNVRDEFAMFPMADIYPSLPMVTQGLMQLGEKATGIGDIQLGQMNSLPGRTPATTMMSLMAEGKRRPDLTIKDWRNEGLSKIGERVLSLCQQNASSPIDIDGKQWLRIVVDALGTPEGQEVAEKLATPMEPVELGLGVTLTATSASNNQEMEKQGSLALLQLAGQVTPQFLQLIQVAMQAQGTPLGDVALRSAQGLQELYKRTLAQFDERDVESLLPLADHLASPRGAFGTPLSPNGGPGGGAPGAPVPPGMEGLFGTPDARGGATG